MSKLGVGGMAFMELLGISIFLLFAWVWVSVTLQPSSVWDWSNRLLYGVTSFGVLLWLVVTIVYLKGKQIEITRQ